MSKANAVADREQEEEEAACAKPQQMEMGEGKRRCREGAVEACLGMSYLFARKFSMYCALDFVSSH